MTDDLQELGRRAVACRAWRWMPGMLTLHDDDGRTWRRCAAMVPQVGGHMVQEDGRRIRSCCPPMAALLPDLSDAATAGCALALVREAWGRMYGSTAADFPIVLVSHWVNGARVGWSARTDGGGSAVSARGEQWMWPTEAEALVVALEAAPVQP